MRRARLGRIAVNQALQAVLVGLLVGLALSAVRVWDDLSGARERMVGDVRLLMETVAPAGAQAAYEVDARRAMRSIHGLSSHPLVARVMLSDDFGTVLASYSRPMQSAPAWMQRLLFPEGPALAMPLRFNGRSVGELVVVLDEGHVARGLIAHAGNEVAFNVVASLIFAAVLACVFYYSLTRPLARLQRGLSAVDPDKPGLSRLTVPPRHEDDEIGAVARAVNFLLGRIEQTMERRRAAEEDLRQRESHYRILFENTGAATMIFGDDGVIKHCNSEYARLTGYEREEIEGRMRWKDMVAFEDRERMLGYHARRLDAEPPPSQYEYTAMRANGSLRRCIVSVMILPGTRDRISSVLDVTERRQVENDLKLALEAAERANKAKSEFLANMSHEIRTPLNGVLGMLQLLGSTELEEEQQEYVDVALSSGKSLLTVINDVLDFSKMEAGILDIVAEPLDLRETVRMVVDNFAIQLKEKGLDVGVEVGDEVPVVVVGDEARLRQVLFNLLGNAVKFTDHGSVTVEVHDLANAGEDHVRLLFSVSDTGVGIPRQMQETVFEAFTQADGSYTRRYQGAGLGLGIVRRIVRLMGGNIAVESEAGQGTVVHYTILFGLPGSADAPKDAGPPVPVATRRLRVLVVEDDATNLLAARRMLEWLGHEAVTVSNGRQALEALARERVDAVLMDVQMPEMDGLEATRAIRAGRMPGVDPALRVIAMTAHAMTGDRERFLDAGMDAYISKPVDMDELAAVLAVGG